MDSIREWQQRLYKLAHDKGWYDTEEGNSFGDSIALIHTEVSEAYEEWRNGHAPNEVYYGPDGKPEGIPIELADVLIRVFGIAQHHGIDLVAALGVKYAYNLTRPYRFGGKRS